MEVICVTVFAALCILGLTYIFVKIIDDMNK